MAPKSSHKLISQFGENLIKEENEINDLFGHKEHWGAIFEKSKNPEYRYMLWRVWDEKSKLMVACMLNPSTADHTKNDPTIQGLILKAKKLGLGGLIVVNIYAYRATSPDEMKKQKDPIGPYNDKAIELAFQEKDSIILCAWGNHGTHIKRDEEIICKIKEMALKPYALKLTKSGNPEHPLYKKSNLMPSEWDIDGQMISNSLLSL